MKYNEETPRHEVTIQGVTVKVPAPYTKGHKLNENEAGALNQVLAENVRNNLASKFKESKDENGNLTATVAELQAMVDEYVEGYEFGVRTGGGRTADPVEREARAITESKVKAAYEAKTGNKWTDVEAAQRREMVSQALEKHPQIREQARAIVAARQSVLGEIDLGEDAA